MRLVTGGLLLASVLVLASCAKKDEAASTAAAAAPASFSIPVAEGEDGVLAGQTLSVQGKNGYSAKLTLTPIWRVQGGVLNVTWYAGLSQTKRFFQITEEAGDPKGKPAWLAQPDQGVREVRVSFDGGALVANKPTTVRSPFTVPAGAKTVTRIELDYGDPGAPQTLTWK